MHLFDKFLISLPTDDILDLKFRNQYFDPISAIVIIGAHDLSGIGASFVVFASQIFSRFFGGRSRNYENKLQELYKIVDRTDPGCARKIVRTEILTNLLK